MSRTDELIEQYGPYGVSLDDGKGSKVHVVNRRTNKTLCGRNPLTSFGIDLSTRTQISCRRCHKLAFTSVNARASTTPND